jgi:hypothetical protein
MSHHTRPRVTLAGFLLLSILVSACTDRSPVATRAPVVLLTAADSAYFRANRFEALLPTSGPPQGSVNHLSISAGETITVTITSAECSGVGDVMEVQGPVSGVISTDACQGTGASITLGPSSTDGALSFVLTDQRFGSGPFAVTGAYPDYTVYVEDGFGDGDYNDNILSVHFTPPNCPPSGDTLGIPGGTAHPLDDPAVRHGLKDALLNSNPNAAPGTGVKKEHGGVIWQRADGSMLTQDIPDPNATECMWKLPPGTLTPPEPNLVAIAKFHTHPGGYLEPTYGCPGPGKLAQSLGDHFPVPKATPDANGGGSTDDWTLGVSDGYSNYVINKDGRIYRLDPNTPKNQWSSNPNHWEWKNPGTPGCATHLP